MQGEGILKREDDKESISILEAMDNLSSMSELDGNEIDEQKSRSDEGLELVDVYKRKWLDVKDQDFTVNSVKNTLKAVHGYMKNIYSKGKHQLKTQEMQKGLASLFTLATEAANRIDSCSDNLKTSKSIEKISESKEFLELKKFYENNLAKKIEKALSEQESWQEEWGKEQDVLDIERVGLKDLETVKRDYEYELFFIAKEDGTRYYNRNLVRHIRLVSNFDQMINQIVEDDPLTRIKLLQDFNVHNISRKTVAYVRKSLDKWFKLMRKNIDESLIMLVFKLVLALLLSTNPKNQLSVTMGKSSLEYFKDYLYFLRQALSHVSYQRIINIAQSKRRPIDIATLDLLHSCCYIYFYHFSDNSKAISFLRRLLQRKNKKEAKIASTYSVISLFNKILEHRDNLEYILKYYPNGPLFKVLDTLNTPHQHLEFDPYLHDDTPQAYYSLLFKGNRIGCMQLACPTRQTNIDKAIILDEFKGFLRHLESCRKNERLLIFNYQDRTSWQSYTRSDLVERYQKDAEISDILCVVTIPKNTEFYFQSEAYLTLNSAQDFIQVLQMQLKEAASSGFFFEGISDISALLEFSEKCAKLILKHFFANKKLLSRKNRLDFIEIFYQFLQMKIVDIIDPSIIGFMSKDSIDVTSTAACGFYAFFKILLEKNPFKEESDDDFLEMLFLPALMIRERGIDIQLLSRLMSFLSITASDIEVRRNKLINDFNALYSFKFERSVQVVKEELR